MRDGKGRERPESVLERVARLLQDSRKQESDEGFGFMDKKAFEMLQIEATKAQLPDSKMVAEPRSQCKKCLELGEVV